ncbi:hypothetical protein PTI98_010866 [Pleurotus ostreatus]|nr:hypothetical protein PTI98_010866 [Pleurotus ostreatus]
MPTAHDYDGAVYDEALHRVDGRTKDNLGRRDAQTNRHSKKPLRRTSHRLQTRGEPPLVGNDPYPPAASILKCSMPITQAPFPDVCFSSVTIFGNVRKEVAEELKAHSESYMALIPFGAGNKIFEQARVLTTATADLVSALANDGTQYSVAAPVQEDAPPHKAWFARPFAMILKDPSPSLRKTLLDTKTVAYRRNGENFAFLSSNIPLSENSWIVCNFKGGPVMNRPEKMTEALTAISRQICQLNGLRSLANRILSKEGVGQSSEERIHVAIAGLSLIYIDRRDEEDREDPVWQLHGKPLTKLDKEHREWLRAVRHVSFFIDSTTELIQERARVGCVWCKSELHTNLNCPLPRVKDWLGPQPPKERLTPEPRDTSSSKEGKRATRKERKGKGKARD